MSNMNEYEFESELNEFEAAGESGEGEGIFGALSGLFGEGELEQHEQHEFEGLGEWEAGELHELGELHEFGANHEMGELHEMGEMHELGEFHEMGELHELGEFEGGEQFFGKIANFVKKNSGLLKNIAKFAAPLVGTAIGGPLGGMLGKAATMALGEGELHELELELEAHEYEHPEASHEVAHEIAKHETTTHEAFAEMLAEAAAHEQNEAHAEAMMGAAVVSVLTPADRAALRRVLPHLVRGAAILTRVLRRRRATRPYVRTVPQIVRRATRDMKRQAASGRPITRRTAAVATAKQVRRVLGNPTACAAAIRKNVSASRRVASSRRAVVG
jgi:hypothetical protein